MSTYGTSSMLDLHTPRLVALYRQKATRTGRIAEALSDILKVYDLQVDEPDITNTPVALLTLVIENTTDSVHFCPASTVIVSFFIDIIISDVPWLADAFALLFDLMYALHLVYPKKLVHTFTFIQKVLMGLDDGKPLKPCLMKNDLLLKE